MAINPQENFKNLLTDLFQLDKSDLDFGIYRIFCNADNTCGAESTEKEFFRLMGEGIDYE
jgi:hypothetical protein